MLYQLWDRQRLQGNHAGHEDAPKLGKKKKKKNLNTLMSMQIKKVSFDTFSGLLGI